jgi:Fe-S-cluster containining protein
MLRRLKRRLKKNTRPYGLRRIYRDIDKAWATAVKEIKAAGGRVNCGRRCSACCRDKRYFVPLPVSKPEANLILEALDALPEEEQQQILGQHYTDHGHYCVFLGMNGCLIYPARPLRCRLYGLPGSPWECKLNSAPDGLASVGRWSHAVDDALDKFAKLDGRDRISYYDIVERWRRK